MEISIEEISKSFEAHLEIPENEQVIFSGRFGIGKSYFLEKFFEYHDEEYSAVILSPINYSVASNKDVFEYIKYDVLFELLKKGAAEDKNEETNQEQALKFLQSIDLKAFGSILKMIPKVGKDLSDVMEGFSELKDHVEKFRENFDQESQIVSFLNSHTQELGSIYEENFTTELINDLIENLKNEKLKTVLVIEDLDRLDPDHIFRILNIFSIHTNYQSGRFKFDFDKIILVCDIKNIQNIYKHRYGSDVDFEGYIDKFYSHEVFHFRNMASVKRELKSLISKSLNHDNISDESNLFNLNWITDILFNLTDINLLTPRKLGQIYNFKYNIKGNKELFNAKIKIRNDTIIRFLKSPNTINFLIYALGSLDELINAVQIIKHKRIYFEENHDYKAMVTDILCLYDYEHNLNQISNNSFVKYPYNGYELKIDYQLADFPVTRNMAVQNIEVNIESPVKKSLDFNEYPDLFYNLFYDTLLKVKDESILNLNV